MSLIPALGKQTPQGNLTSSRSAKFILKKKEKGEKCVGASVLQADFKLRGQKRAPDCLELKLITPGCELGIETPSSGEKSRLQATSSFLRLQLLLDPASQAPPESF